MKNKRSLRLLIIATCLFTIVQCVPYVRKPRRDNLVRVALVCGAARATVTGMHKKKYYNDYSLNTGDIGASPFLLSGYNGQVLVNGKPYHGNLEIRKLNDRLWVINILDMEAYLKGVVPCEIGFVSEPVIEAAKAQAVAARTYAYAHMNQYDELGFDLYATIKDQVYNGINSERELTNRAVDETAGEVLTYHNALIEAKYHSTCGGRTADFNDAWPGIPPPYLRSVPCPYCTESPHYAWEKVLPKALFFARLRAQVAKVGIAIPKNDLIKNIILTRNTQSKRARTIVIVTENAEYTVPGYQIRTVFGDSHDPAGLLKSNYITVVPRGDSIAIEGRGFGHGVGMCQYGALEMARQGKNYRSILTHYYTGTRIRKVY